MDLLISPALNHFSIVALVVLSFLCSALTAAVGAGGGLLMLSVMASTMPAAAVIPVHGIVQLGSNGGRALLARSHIAPRVTALLLAGGAAGALLGSSSLSELADGAAATQYRRLSCCTWSGRQHRVSVAHQPRA